MFRSGQASAWVIGGVGVKTLNRYKFSTIKAYGITDIRGNCKKCKILSIMGSIVIQYLTLTELKETDGGKQYVTKTFIPRIIEHEEEDKQS